MRGGGYIVEVVSFESAGERISCDSFTCGLQKLQSSITFAMSSLLSSHNNANMIPLRSRHPPLEMGERIGTFEENDVTPLRLCAKLRDVDCVP